MVSNSGNRMQTNLAEGKGAGYARWAQSFNLK